MTLTERIHTLTGADRNIDAEVAVLLEWLPADFAEEYGYDDKPIGREANEYKTGVVTLWFADIPKNRRLHLQPPKFTASLGATLDEIRRREWAAMCDFGFEQALCDIWETPSIRLSHVCRNDQNDALAALEALVRAVGDGK